MPGETEEKPSGWSVDTLHVHMQSQLNDLQKMLDERYATQTKAIEAAFDAQQVAMQTAFTAADRAVQAALQSAEKAVTKAEAAAEKRFEAVNEFRGQLADQAATLMARSEADVRFTALADRLLKIESRLDIGAGEDKSGAATQARGFAVAGIAAAVLALIVSIVSVILLTR